MNDYTINTKSSNNKINIWDSLLQLNNLPCYKIAGFLMAGEFIGKDHLAAFTNREIQQILDIPAPTFYRAKKMLIESDVIGTCPLNKENKRMHMYLKDKVNNENDKR